MTSNITQTTMPIDLDDGSLWQKNRDRKTAASPKRAGWCDGCDRSLIRPGEKCSVCGFRDRKTKHMKPSA